MRVKLTGQLHDAVSTYCTVSRECRH